MSEGRREYNQGSEGRQDNPAGLNGHSSRGREGSYSRGSDAGTSDRAGGFDRDRGDRQKSGAMEVVVDHSIEKAMKILKRKLIKEGLFKELKLRRYYEKPSERRKRKQKEALKKSRKEEARQKKNPFMTF